MRAWMLLFTVVALLSAAPSAAAVVAYAELPDVARRATDLTVDADGNVWLTADDAHGVLRYDPATRRFDLVRFTATRSSDPDAALLGIAAHPDGTVWTSDGASIHRIDGRTLAERSIPIPGAQPPVTDLAVAADGAILLAAPATGRVLRLTAASDAVQALQADASGFAPYLLAVEGQEARVAAKDGRLARVDASTVAVAGPQLEGIRALAWLGHAWAADSKGGFASLVEGGTERYGAPEGALDDLVATADGRLVLAHAGARLLGVVSPTTGAVDGHRFEGAAPKKVALDADGAVWFIDANEPRIGRWTPAAPSAFPVPAALMVKRGGSTQADVAGTAPQAFAPPGLSVEVQGAKVTVRAAKGASEGVYHVLVLATGEAGDVGGAYLEVTVKGTKGIPGVGFAGILALLGALVLARRSRVA